MTKLAARRAWTAVLSGALLAGCGGAPPPAPTNPAPAAATPASQAPVIGPNGYGTLMLRMSFDDVRAAGFIRTAEPPGESCQRYDLYSGAARDGSVFITGERGVEAIVPDRRVRTAEGVEVGWTAAQVRTVHADVDLAVVAEMGRTAVAPHDNPAAVYRFGFDGDVLGRIALQLPDQSCYE